MEKRKIKSELRKSGSLEGKRSDGGGVAIWKMVARVDFIKEVSSEQKLEEVREFIDI